MKDIKWGILMVIGLTLFGVILYACTNRAHIRDNVSGTIEGKVNAFEVKLPDGAIVNCISWNQGNYVGGLTCDWANKK